MKIKIIIPLLIIISFLCGTVFGGFATSRIIKCDTSQTTKKTIEQNKDESGLPDNISESTILDTHSDLSETANSSETTQSTQIEKETEFKDELAEFLSSRNILLSNNITAFISASSEQNRLTFYLKEGSHFEEVFSCYAWFGINGVSDNKKEGDLCTPCGLFELGTAFGLENNPGTEYPFKKASENSYWVDDPDSRFYNQWVELTEDTIKDWKSAEKLSDYPNRYNYGIVIEYNTVNTVPGNGSAIFLHCGDRSTLGCIAINSNDMQKLLLNLHKEDTAQIYIY